MDDKLKKLLQDEMQKEADIIMELVNEDPMVKDAEAPDSVREKLFQQIREYEEQKTEQQISEENQELIRLGKVYKKKRRRRKYYLLVAIFALLLFGGTITTLGGPKRVFQEVKRLVGGREQSKINTDSEQVSAVTDVSEEEAYQRIEDEFGVFPIRIDCLPDNMFFSEFYYDEILQQGCLVYESEDEKKTIVYTIYPNYRTSSIAKDIEDTFIKSYNIQVSGEEMWIKEYVIEENGTSRWIVQFEYQDMQYFMTITGAKEQDVKNLVENLIFP